MTPRTRVVHIITKLALGGAQATVLELSRGLDSNRFDVHVACGPERDREGSLEDDFGAAGIGLHVVPSLGRSVNALGDARSVGSVRALLRRLQPDVVHTHTSKAGAVGRLAARLSGVPATVHTVHGWSFDHRGGRYVRAMIEAERMLARLCDRLVVVTTQDEFIGRRHGIGGPDQYVCIRSGIEPARFAFSPCARAATREQLGLQIDTELVGTVGRFSEQKDPITLLRAFHLVARARPRAHLLLVGDGPLRNEVERTIDQLWLRDRVHVVGAQHDPTPWYAAMDVFALSSRWEGLPRVALEAMAAGLPVASTKTSGMCELGERGAVLSAIGDAGALAGAITHLLERPRCLRMMPAWIDEFSVERMVAETTALYEQLVPVPVLA